MKPSSELPASATVLGRRTLALAGVQHFEDVLGLVPNLNWSAGTSRPRYFQLRGIGELEQFQGAPNASVGFLIDDIDFSGIGMPATLFDVEQIEVLRGPQGTTYGANALGGADQRAHARAEPASLSCASKRPQAITARSGAGAVIGGPLGSSAKSQPIAWSRSVIPATGSVATPFSVATTPMASTKRRLRGKLRWQPREDLQLDFTALFADLDNGYDAFAIDNSRTTHSDKPGRDAQRSLGLAARAQYTGFRPFTLRSTTTVADSDIRYSFDGDWGNDRDWGAFAPYDFTSHFVRNRQTWSEDLRAVSTPGAEIGGRAAWLAGLYVLHARGIERSARPVQWRGGHGSLSSRYAATNVAAYGEVDLGLTSAPAAPRGNAARASRRGLRRFQRAALRSRRERWSAAMCRSIIH